MILMLKRAVLDRRRSPVLLRAIQDGRLVVSDAINTRGSSATRVTEAGVLVQDGAGVTRQDHWIYDAGGVRRRTVLLEAQGTNLIPSSEDTGGAGWTTSTGGGPPLSVTPGIVAPDGVTHMSVVDLSGTSSRRLAAATGVNPAGLTVTLSFWARLPDGVPNGKHVTAYLRAAPNGLESSPGLQTTAMDGTARRYTLTYAFSGAPGGTNLSFALVGSPSGSDAVCRIEVWRPQIEAAATASTPIPTAGSAVTRAADALTLPAAPSAGTLYQRWVHPVTLAVQDSATAYAGGAIVPTLDRAYTHLAVVPGTRSAAECRTILGVV